MSHGRAYGLLGVAGRCYLAMWSAVWANLPQDLLANSAVVLGPDMAGCSPDWDQSPYWMQ